MFDFEVIEKKVFECSEKITENLKKTLEDKGKRIEKMHLKKLEKSNRPKGQGKKKTVEATPPVTEGTTTTPKFQAGVDFPSLVIDDTTGDYIFSWGGLVYTLPAHKVEEDVVDGIMKSDRTTFVMNVAAQRAEIAKTKASEAPKETKGEDVTDAKVVSEPGQPTTTGSVVDERADELKAAVSSLNESSNREPKTTMASALDEAIQRADNPTSFNHFVRSKKKGR